MHTDVLPCLSISDHGAPYSIINIRVTRFAPPVKTSQVDTPTSPLVSGSTHSVTSSRNYSCERKPTKPMTLMTGKNSDLYETILRR